jgi:diguanylate cyclase (GGDEF)-like protein/putative nucleotidyltransferase with HDIG domain
MKHPGDGGFRGLPRRGQAVLAAALFAAVIAVAACWGAGADLALAPWLLVVLGVACATASLVEVFAPGSYSLQPNIVFFAWAMLVVPSWALAALAAVCFTPSLIARRVALHKAAFNWANYVLAAIAGQAVARASDFPADGRIDARAGIVLALAATAFVVVNHGLLGVMMTAALQRSPARAFATLGPAVPVDLAMALCGAAVAVLWKVTPSLALLGAGPLVLTFAALRIPMLEHLSRTDPKTGLFNLQHLQYVFADELVRAGRSGSPVSVVMFDLDRLRTINNRFGHLAGDEAIVAFARVLAEVAEPDGIPARFGGEEFALLLPGRSSAEAHAVALSVRSRLKQVEPPWSAEAGVSLTVSAGVAAYPGDGRTATALLEAADGALYEAKIGGRDRVRVTGDRPAPPEAAPSVEPRAAPGPDAVLAAMAQRTAADGAEAASSAMEARADVAQESPPPPRSRHRLLPWYVALLVVGCGAAAVSASTGHLAAAPVLFGLLVASAFALDGLSVDLFGRGNVSPGSVATLSLAFLYGPLGPLAAEVAVALKRCAKREPAIRWIFDVAALGLAGAAASASFAMVPVDGRAGVLLAAVLGSAAYYVTNVSLLAIVMALNERRHPFALWRERLAWLGPQYLAFGLLAGGLVLAVEPLGTAALMLFVVPVLMFVVVERQYVNRSRSSVEQLRRRQDELENANQRLRDLLDRNETLLRGVRRSYVSTITSLARTIEAKDPYTGGHTERVADLACSLAAQLGFLGADLDAVEVGGVIHDIGKIGIPDAVLLKPDRLTDDEFAEMRRHPEISSYILGELELPQIVKEMARNHHERYDGGGYPDRLAGDDIPLAARILTVADALDAMTSDRPYRRALPLDVALAEIERQAGRQFCPMVVAALRACLEDDPTLGGHYAGPSESALDDSSSAPRGASPARR